MFSKILILALLGCSLVLASPKPQNENVLDVFKPENAVKTGVGLLNLAGNAVKNFFGTGKKLVEASVSQIKKGASKIIEFQKNLIAKTIENLVKIIAFLNEQLFALGAGKVLEPSLKIVENISNQVNRFIEKGLDSKSKDPVKDIADNLGNLVNELPKDEQKKAEDKGFLGNIVGDVANNVNGFIGKVSGAVEDNLNVPEKANELIGGVNPLEDNDVFANIFGNAVGNANQAFGKVSETVEDNLNIPEKINGLMGTGKGIIGKVIQPKKKGCFGKVVQKVSGAVDKATDALGDVTEEGSKKLTHMSNVVEAAVEKFGKGKNSVSQENQEPTEKNAPKEKEKSGNFFTKFVDSTKGFFGK